MYSTVWPDDRHSFCFLASLVTIPKSSTGHRSSIKRVRNYHTATMKTRQPSSSEQTIIDEVLTLYQLKPTERSYCHYRTDAVFHDPVSIAKGLDSIKSQFNGMPKIFERSDTQKCEVIDDGTPNTIALNLTQYYVFKGGKTPEKEVNSKVTLKLDEEGMIKNHDEEWDHQKNQTGDDGFAGKLQELRKKADAKIVEAGVSSDPKKI